MRWDGRLALKPTGYRTAYIQFRLGLKEVRGSGGATAKWRVTARAESGMLSARQPGRRSEFRHQYTRASKDKSNKLQKINMLLWNTGDRLSCVSIHQNPESRGWTHACQVRGIGKSTRSSTQGKEIVGRENDTAKKVMDRRHFLQTASLLAAGSALGFPLVGCSSESELVIPCLGPAAAPTPVAGMTYLWASKIGCALDCNLENGSNKYTGGAATDDGPRINAAMAGATAANPITLIIDGSALISGLFLPAGGNWGIAGLGCGTGFFVKSGANSDGIHNGSPTAAIPSDPGPPAPARGMNVSLSSFTLNGNQGNGLTAIRRAERKRERLTQGATVWYFGINLMNLDNITIENVVVVNTPAYHFRFSNVGNVAVSGCVMQSQGMDTDGLHFDGLANDITISNCSFSMGDDAIALNCPEGYSGNRPCHRYQLHLQ